jgi:hypothetical protein
MDGGLATWVQVLALWAVMKISELEKQLDKHSNSEFPQPHEEELLLCKWALIGRNSLSKACFHTFADLPEFV